MKVYIFNDLLFIDLTDIPEDENYNDYLNDSIFAITDSFEYNHISQAIEICNETINNYNR